MNQNWIFTFGKHKGERLGDVAKADIGYVLWCFENLEWFARKLIAAKSDPWVRNLAKEMKRARQEANERTQAWAWGVL